MVSAPNDPGAPLSRDTFEQRFNVAASRARDRMYLVRSVGLEHLSAADKLRRNLIGHFAAPFTQDEDRVDDLRKLCESPFEREFYDELTQRGYWVTPQVRVGQYRIDMLGRLLNLAITALLRVARMIHCAGSNHVEDDVNQTTMQVLVCCDGRSVIAIFPECALLAFPLVVFLRCSPGDQLHAPRDNIFTGILHQKVDVIGCHNVIEHAKTETVLRFEEPVEITAPITRKLE